MQREAGEIGDKHIARRLLAATRVVKVLNIAHRLRMSLAQIPATRLVFRDQLAGPQQIDEVGRATQIADGLLERRDGTAADAENLEKLIPKRLAIGSLSRGVGPIARKGGRAVADFVP